MAVDYSSLVLQAVAHAAVFCQKQCQRLTADGSRSVCKCRVRSQAVHCSKNFVGTAAS